MNTDCRDSSLYSRRFFAIAAACALRLVILAPSLAAENARQETIREWQWSTEGRGLGWGAERTIIELRAGGLRDNPEHVTLHQLLIRTGQGNRLRGEMFYLPSIGGYVTTFEDLESGWRFEYQIGIAEPRDILPVPEEAWVQTLLSLDRTEAHPGGVFYGEITMSNGVRLRRDDEIVLSSNQGTQGHRELEVNKALEMIPPFLATLTDREQQWDFPASLLEEIAFLQAVKTDPIKSFGNTVAVLTAVVEATRLALSPAAENRGAMSDRDVSSERGHEAPPDEAPVASNVGPGEISIASWLIEDFGETETLDRLAAAADSE